MLRLSDVTPLIQNRLVNLIFRVISYKEKLVYTGDLFDYIAFKFNILLTLHLIFWIFSEPDFVNLKIFYNTFSISECQQGYNIFFLFLLLPEKGPEIMTRFSC